MSRHPAKHLMTGMRAIIDAPVRAVMLAAAVLLLAGCASAPAESPATKALRLQRRAEAAVAIEERVAQVERRLFLDFYEESLGLITNFNVVRDGRTEKGVLHVEQSAHLLVGLACKYAVTGDPLAQERARRLLAGLEALDRINGLDGFVPLEARVVAGEVEVVGDRFISSSYTQLLYAHLLARRLFADPRLKAEIHAQARRMLDHILSHGLVVVDARGRPLPFSDASLKTRIIGTARELETLSFVRMACLFFEDDPRRLEALLALRKRVEDDYGYARMPYLLHVSTPLFELPTASSSWLNLLKLAALVETTGSMKYRRLLHELADDYRSHENPFFIALDLLYGPELSAGRAEAQHGIALRRLASYPLTNDSHELDNLGRPPYRLRVPPRFVKSTLVLEARRPVPFYDLAGDRYLWKRNLLKLRGNPGGDGRKVYSGVDFYEAYWLLAYAKSMRACGE